jgi:predicted HD superfamily hydrolase involved in NAD metabolism
MISNSTLNDSIVSYLRETLSEKRVEHILRVAETARQLAKAHGLDAARAYTAALLHDNARETPGPVLLEECRRRGIAILPIDEVNPVPRLHGQLGAAIARERFGIEDAELLNAISSHTLGRVGMTPLEMVVFLADYTEPGRDPHEGLDAVREAATQDLALATRMAMDYTMRYLLDKKRSLHPQVVDARNWILTRAGASSPA